MWTGSFFFSFCNEMRSRFLLVALLFITAAHAQLQLNEIMPKNVSFVMDDAYNYSMWVEVYNSSETESMNLSDYYFTNDLNNITRWKPLSETILPKEYTVLWFERDDRIGHSSFKLDPEGATLYLINASLQLIDFVKYPAQYRNISYGRQSEGSSNWVFFEKATPGKSNNTEWWALRCANPVFSLKGGFYSGKQQLSFINQALGETIYFTTDNTEPNLTSTQYQYGNSIILDSTTIVRAKAYANGKLSSNVVSSTFFINERKPHNLRVVSISTDQRFLTNDTIGIYCDGTNGIIGNLQKTPKNFNQDWDRPVNFELFDENGVQVLNQELDIKILGGGSRESALKSISISPKKKFGDNRLSYDIFQATKPGNKYKDIELRNSGNDFKRTMMKDAFIQSIVMHRMDVDYQAYEPAVVYINGIYCGIENMRERSNKDFVYSNFGFDDDEVSLIEATYKDVDSHNDMATDSGFAELSSFLQNYSMLDDANYHKACEQIDVDEYINYLMPEIFIANVDWPYNNVKMWKETKGGKWRWILMDTEYSYGLGRLNHNSLTFALGENTASIIGGYEEAPEWSIVVFSELIKNETFRNKFIDRFAIHLSTTFRPERVIHIMDSIAARIRNELPYHKARYGHTDTFESDLDVFRNFSTQRPEILLDFIGARFLDSPEIKTIHLGANIDGATYSLNGEAIIDSEVDLNYFCNRKFDLVANTIEGNRFSHWLANNQTVFSELYSGMLSADFDLMAVYEPEDAAFAHSSSANTSILLYPSIIEQELYIKNGIGHILIITDMTGRKWFEKKCSSNNEIINVDFLPSGIYLAITKHQSFKLIKK